MRDRLLDNLLLHVRQEKVAIRELAQLAPGVICAHDNLGEWDTYFDSLRWVLKNQGLWKHTVFPPALRRLGMGVLEGVGKFPAVQNFDEALAFARENLRLRGGMAEKWCLAPKRIAFRQF